MTTPLLQSATGQPVKTVWRFAPQTSRTIPAITGFIDARTNGGGPAMSPSTVKRMLLNPSTEPLQELDGKLVFSTDPIDFGDVSATNKGWLYSMLNWYGKYAIFDGTTYYTWTLGRDQATSFADYMTLIGDTDIVPRTRWRDGMSSMSAIGSASHVCAGARGRVPALLKIINDINDLSDPTCLDRRIRGH